MWMTFACRPGTTAGLLAGTVPCTGDIPGGPSWAFPCGEQLPLAPLSSGSAGSPRRFSSRPGGALAGPARGLSAELPAGAQPGAAKVSFGPGPPDQRDLRIARAGVIGSTDSVGPSVVQRGGDKRLGENLTG